MEPFGLFRFLQSFLESESSKTDLPRSRSEDGSPPVPEQKEEKENACARFLEAHDARARKFRK